MIWEKERVMFPYMLADSSGYIGPDKELLPEHAKMIVHSRMCFYQASDGRMLATTFYGFHQISIVRLTTGLVLQGLCVKYTVILPCQICLS